jgi:hypothetical protein
MYKFVSLVFGMVLGVGLVFSFARFLYRPTPSKQASTFSMGSMVSYIEKQKQTLSSINHSEFDAKATQQMELFLANAITMTDTAKANPKHTDLRQFAIDSTYSWGYNHESSVIIEENLGLRPKHEGKHCDSVGSC